jgi:WD40 repeat protein
MDEAYGGGILSAATSPNGGSLAVGGQWAAVSICDVESRHAPLRFGAMPEAVTEFSNVDKVLSLAFSPDGATLATSCGFKRASTIMLWDIATGKAKATLDDTNGTVFAVAFSPDGKTLAAAGDDLRFYHPDTGRKFATSARRDRFRPQLHAYSLAFSPDGTLLASGGYDKTVKLWQAKIPLNPTPK